MVIFHSYVNVYQRVSIHCWLAFFNPSWKCFRNLGPSIEPAAGWCALKKALGWGCLTPSAKNSDAFGKAILFLGISWDSMGISSHMLHGAGIFTYIWVIFWANIGNYSSTMEHMGLNLMGYPLVSTWQAGKSPSNAMILRTKPPWEIPKCRNCGMNTQIGVMLLIP